MSASAWIRRLGSLAPLSPIEVSVLEEVEDSCAECNVRESLAVEGDASDQAIVVMDGIVCEQKLSSDGRRQILAYLFAGDMPDPRQVLLPTWDHSICVLWPARVATIDRQVLQRLNSHEGIALAITRYTLRKQAIAREWMVNVGHRTAFERVGHLLCETYNRLTEVGLSAGYGFHLPLTQAELGDALALTSVHVNRTLMELRRLGLMTFQNRYASIHDYKELCAMVGFDAHYLRLRTSDLPGAPPLRISGDHSAGKPRSS